MQFKVIDIRLKKSFFSLNEEILTEDKEFTIKRELSVGLSRNDEDKNLIKVIVQVKNEEKESPFNFDLVYEGFFKFDLKEEISDEKIEEVGIINCAAIIFPYLREHLADLTRRSGLPAFHLPPVNFVKVYKNQLKGDN